MTRPEGDYQGFIDTIRRLERELAELRRRSPLAGTGISVTGQKKFTVDGDMVITGTLTADRKVPEAALVNVLRNDYTRAVGQGFSITTTPTVVSTVTWDFPPGMTRAAVNVAGSKVFAFNNNFMQDYLYCMTRVTRVSDGIYTDGTSIPVFIGGSGQFGHNVCGGGGVIIAGTTTDKVRIDLLVWSQTQTLAANASNTAIIEGSLNWSR